MVLFFILIILYFRGNQLEDQVPILNLKKNALLSSGTYLTLLRRTVAMGDGWLTPPILCWHLPPLTLQYFLQNC